MWPAARRRRRLRGDAELTQAAAAPSFRRFLRRGPLAQRGRASYLRPMRSCGAQRAAREGDARPMMFAEFAALSWLGAPVWMWTCFVGLVLALLAFDLGVLNRTPGAIGVGASLRMSAFYIALGLGFGGFVWHTMGPGHAYDYWTGFLVEKTLSMDNVFVIALVFSFFGIPRQYQHRVLFYGILGVIVLRGVMIGVGAALVREFEWVLLLFAAFLIVTGVKLLIAGDSEPDFSRNRALMFLRRNLRVTDQIRDESFFVRLPVPSGALRTHVTPLFLALMVIEAADLIFAIDSIPAIFAITTEPFVVYTSNIFAILGLRALFFALSALTERFHYLKYALALLLVFIGAKVIAADALGIEKVPPAISLGVAFTTLLIGVLYSLWRTRGAAAPDPVPVPAEPRA
jgi:tellurite resistance protein TerC